jgi:hypothetical protein
VTKITLRAARMICVKQANALPIGCIQKYVARQRLFLDFAVAIQRQSIQEHKIFREQSKK